MANMNQLVITHKDGTSTFQIEDTTKVSFSNPQSLNPDQQAQARANIGVNPIAMVVTFEDGTTKTFTVYGEAVEE